MADICYSGGSNGADFAFTKCALEAGHAVVNYSFEGHRISVPEQTIQVLPEHILMMALPQLEEAEKVLEKNIPNNPYTLKLMLRDYFQINKVDRIYAVREINEKNLVMGGTGCTVTMGLLHGVEEIYVFDPVKDAWFIWCGIDVRYPDQRLWTEHCGRPPKPRGSYSGIGEHNLHANSLKAIQDLYK